MRSVRVDRTEKEASCAGGFHHHVTALETAGGARLRTGPVIAEIRLRAVTYHLVLEGAPVALVVRDSCRRCSQPYVATAADTLRHEWLLELPDIGPHRPRRSQAPTRQARPVRRPMVAIEA